MERNVELASLVIQAVRARPGALDIFTWTDAETERRLTSNDHEQARAITCDTAGCLAGWTMFLGAPLDQLRLTAMVATWAPDAVELLGIDLDSADAARLRTAFGDVRDRERAITTYARVFGLDPHTGQRLTEPATTPAGH